MIWVKRHYLINAESGLDFMTGTLILKTLMSDVTIIVLHNTIEMTLELPPHLHTPFLNFKTLNKFSFPLLIHGLLWHSNSLPLKAF